MSQAQSLRKVADAMNKVLKNNPAETFLIEGHTDAVGSDESNLVLSDERAESVANVIMPRRSMCAPPRTSIFVTAKLPVLIGQPCVDSCRVGYSNPTLRACFSTAPKEKQK